MSRSFLCAPRALHLAVVTCVAATRLAVTFVAARQCYRAPRGYPWSTAAPLGASAATCQGSGARTDALTVSIGVVCAVAVAVAGRLGSRSPSRRKDGRVVTLQAAMYSHETMPTSVLQAQFCLVGSSSPRKLSSVKHHSLVAMGIILPKPGLRRQNRPTLRPFHPVTKWKAKRFVQHAWVPHFGKYALQALEEAWFSNKQIEEIRRQLTQSMERKGKVFMRVFPHNAIRERVAESRVGATKGNIDYWVAAVKPNYIIFEIDGVSEEVATRAFRKVSYKLPCRCKMVKKENDPSMYELGLAGG